jgi:putative acetyltransferase
MQRMLANPENQIAIVPFRDEFAAAFESLNRAWLEQFDLLEDGDLPYLLDPRGAIIDKGGVVLCAVLGSQMIGTVSVIRHPGSTFELAKLAVSPAARGRGLGRRLTQAAIDFALTAGAKSLFLSSNHRLRDAIRLYESLGFKPSAAPPGVVTYATADMFMQLSLNTSPIKGGEGMLARD